LIDYTYGCIRDSVRYLPDNAVPNCDIPTLAELGDILADMNSDEKVPYADFIDAMIDYNERNCSKYLLTTANLKVNHIWVQICLWTLSLTVLLGSNWSVDTFP